MRDFKKSKRRRWIAGWFCPLVLLALPHCTLDKEGHLADRDPVIPAFFPGNSPTSAIMCDIPKPLPEGESECAKDGDIAAGIKLTEAAIALVTGKKNPIGLDYSPLKVAACGGNKPGKIVFFDPFPDGSAVCLNCGTQIPAVYPDAKAACVAKCKHLVIFGGGPIPADVDAFCAKARVSTNFDKVVLGSNTCFANVCSGATPPPNGPLPPNYVDPRRTPENVKWADPLIGVTDNMGSNSLTKTSLTAGPNTSDFNAGAASEQLIEAGDAWVELEASEINRSHVLGVRTSCADVPACPDQDPGVNAIGFAISLNSDGQVWVIESGPPWKVRGPFGTYTAGERFRVRVADNHNKTATISYIRCESPTACTAPPFEEQEGASPDYPLRVDTSFREKDATLANVTMVRIRKQ